MGRPPALPLEQKVRAVLAVLSGRQTASDAALEHKVSDTSVCNWKRQFIEAGRAGLDIGSTPRRRLLEAELTAENSALRSLLREAHGQIRTWKTAAGCRLGPSRTSR